MAIAIPQSAEGPSSPPPLQALPSYQEDVEQTHQSTSEAEKKQMEANFQAYLVTWRKTARERMIAFAEQGEADRKHGYELVPPPLEIAHYPDLLERAWGFHRILPYHHVNSWSLYKKYLQQYYTHNDPHTALAHQMEDSAAGDGSLNGDDGNNLPALVQSCIKMERELEAMLSRRPGGLRNVERGRSDKIINCVREMINVKCCEFPAAAIALKCITKEADLMCELVMSGICSTSPWNVSSDIRQCAVSFMTYKGDEYFAAAATMMGVMREAQVMCEVLRKERDDKKDEFSRSHFFRCRTLVAMVRICSEYPAAEESTMGSTAGKLVHEESADKSGLEMESVKEDNTGERNHTEDKNKEKPAEGDYHLMKERNKNQRTKEDGVNGDNLDESVNQKIEVDVPKQDILVGKRHTKHGSKLEELLKIPIDDEFDEKANLLSSYERKEVSGKAVENASKSAAEGKKAWKSR